MISILIACAALGLAGYAAVVARRAARQAAEVLAANETMERLAPPRRIPGTPTNLDAEPSHVSQPRFFTGRRFREGDE